MTHRPPPPPMGGMPPSPQHRQELAIASAAEAFALLCKKLVVSLESTGESEVERLRRQLVGAVDALRLAVRRAEGANARAQWVAEPARDFLACAIMAEYQQKEKA